MASETITRNDLTAILNEVLPPTIAGITPDYGSAVSIASLPYTAPNFGIIIYTIGDGTNAGERNLTVNGVEVARARCISGGTTTVTALVSKEDTVSGALGIWGTMRFVPYRLTVATDGTSPSTRIKHFTLPNTLGFSTWNGYGFKDYATGTVRIYITAYNASQINGTRITTVPSDCLPTATQLISGVVGLDINSIFLGSCRIDSTTGDITNTASSVTRQVMVSAEYVYK